jgi:hypothetical protein
MKERSAGVNFSMPLSLLDPVSNLDYPNNFSALISSFQPKKNKSEHFGLTMSSLGKILLICLVLAEECNKCPVIIL